MKDLKNKGWVRLHRRITDNSLWFLEPFTKAQAWIDLFLNCNHKDGLIQVRGNIIPIKRGQIGWSELTMAKRWTWSKNRVRNFLKLLETEQQIVQQKDRFITTIITILNYEEYQNDTTDDTAERQQKDSRRYINKNVKNDKNDKNTLQRAQSAQDIVALFDLFRTYNPGISFDNRTERGAAAWLLAQYGMEKARETTQYALSVQGKPYAPTITTPYQLKTGLGKLRTYYLREKAPRERSRIGFINNGKLEKIV